MGQTITLDSLPGLYDWNLYQGATFSKVVTYEQGNPAAPVDLTGATAAMTARTPDGTVVLSLTTSNGGIVLGGTAGTITLSYSASDTAALPVGSFVYDLLITYPNGGRVEAFLAGSILVTQGVTA